MPGWELLTTSPALITVRADGGRHTKEMHMGYRRRWVPKEPSGTCPTLDDIKARVQRMKGVLIEYIEDAVTDLNNQIEDARKENVSLREWGNDIIDAADSQIDDLTDQIDDLTDQIDDLKKQVA